MSRGRVWDAHERNAAARLPSLLPKIIGARCNDPAPVPHYCSRP